VADEQAHVSARVCADERKHARAREGVSLGRRTRAEMDSAVGIGVVAQERAGRGVRRREHQRRRGRIEVDPAARPAVRGPMLRVEADELALHESSSAPPSSSSGIDRALRTISLALAQNERAVACVVTDCDDLSSGPTAELRDIDCRFGIRGHHAQQLTGFIPRAPCAYR